MKKFLLALGSFFLVYLFVMAQDKPVAIVDKKLDPLYFQSNFDNLVPKRMSEFRKGRKGEVPELIWKIKTNGTITAPITFIENMLMIGTSTGNINYIHQKNGAVDEKNGFSTGMIVMTGIQNNNYILAMTWLGALVSYPIKYPRLAITSFGGQKNRESLPLGGMVWQGGGIVTRRDNYPIMMEMTEGKVIASPSKTWSHGEATTPLLSTGEVFYLATSKGELLSFDQKLTTVTSTLRLPKSYATALAFETNSLYVLTADKELLAYDLKTSNLKWQKKVAGNGVNSMICEGGLLYVNAGNFYVIDPAEGNILLEKQSISYEKFMRTKPVVTDKRIFSCDSEGNIFIFRKSDYRILQIINLDEDVMVDFVVDKTVIYIATIAGHLYALDASYY